LKKDDFLFFCLSTSASVNLEAVKQTRMQKKEGYIQSIVESKKDNPGFSKTREEKRLGMMKKDLVISEYEALPATHEATKGRVKWDEEMVEALLNLRLVQRITSTQQRHASWEKLTLAWNTRMTIAKNSARMTSKQLQEKYIALKV